MVGRCLFLSSLTLEWQVTHAGEDSVKFQIWSGIMLFCLLSAMAAYMRACRLGFSWYNTSRSWPGLSKNHLKLEFRTECGIENEFFIFHLAVTGPNRFIMIMFLGTTSRVERNTVVRWVVQLLALFDGSVTPLAPPLDDPDSYSEGVRVGPVVVEMVGFEAAVPLHFNLPLALSPSHINKTAAQRVAADTWPFLIHRIIKPEHVKMSGIRGEEEDEILDSPKLETVLSITHYSLCLFWWFLLSMNWSQLQWQTPESTEFSTTFVMREEDHTLGNAIRYALNQK